MICAEFWGLILSAANTVVVALSALLIWKQLKAQSGQLELQRKTHLASSFETLSAVWMSERMLKVRRAAAISLIENIKANTEEPLVQVINPEIEHIMEFFDRIGAYEKSQAIDPETIWEVFSWHLEYYSAIVSNDLPRLRNDLDDQYVYNNFTYIAEIMASITKEKQDQLPAMHERESQLGFLRDELQIVETILRADEN